MMAVKFFRYVRLGLIVALFSVAQAFSAEEKASTTATAIVLFDQSGSMGRFDSLAVSKIWLLTFNQTFTDNHQVQLVGFDEDIHDPITLQTGPDIEPAAITKSLGRIKTQGKATDLESPFRYLAEHKDLKDVALILIITDGEPEIWDANLGYLSTFARTDPRYVDLNDLFQQLRKNKDTKAAQYADLRKAYHERNLELIEERIRNLPPEIGAKTVIWDISGRSEFLKIWSRLFGAEYLGVRIASQEDPVGPLQDTLLKLQAKASILISKPLPEDHESRIESVLSTVPEVQLEISEKASKQPESEPGVEPDKPVTVAPVIVAETKPVPIARPDTIDLRLPARISFAIGVLLFSGSLAWLFGFGRNRAVRATNSKPPAPPPDDRSGARGERRTVNRTNIPEGVLTVFWTNRDGSPGQGDAINASLRGLIFRTDNFDSDKIDAIAFPFSGLRLEITRSREIRRNKAGVAVMIEEFTDNIDNWAKWVEHLDHINEEQ